MESDRVRKHTATEVLRQIDHETVENLVKSIDGGPSLCQQRGAQLEQEWDTDRALETEASLMALTGLALGATVSRKFFAMPGLVASMVLLHAVTGAYPLLPIFRRLGLRTQKEIQRERFALKALQGDFQLPGLSGGV